MCAKYNKYKNIPVKIDGIVFHSMSEGRRYKTLKILEAKNEISHLQTQVRYLIVGKPESKMRDKAYYIADFVYEKDGKLVVEDVKNPRLKRENGTRVKLLLMKQEHGIEVICIDPRDV
jgi:hypothetical protein